MIEIFARWRFAWLILAIVLAGCSGPDLPIPRQLQGVASVSRADAAEVLLVQFVQTNECGTCVMAANRIQDSLRMLGVKIHTVAAVQCLGMADVQLAEEDIDRYDSMIPDSTNLRRELGLSNDAKFFIQELRAPYSSVALNLRGARARPLGAGGE